MAGQGEPLQRDIKDLLGNLFISLLLDSMYLLQWVLLVSLCKIFVLIIGMLPSVSEDTSKGLQDKVYYMKIKGIPKFLGIVILIEQDLLWINTSLQVLCSH